jgi:general stress protein YciG
MRITGKQSIKPAKHPANPSTIAKAPGASPKDQEHGEGSYRGTRDYQEGVKSYLRTADVEKDARDAAPADDAEASDMQAAEETGRKGGTKKEVAGKRQVGVPTVAGSAHGGKAAPRQTNLKEPS